MECIEYRYRQGEKNIKAVVQLGENGKYWNNALRRFQDELDANCFLSMLELSYDNVYNENIDSFAFMKLYKDRIEEGLYVTASAELSIAPGALYSIHIYNGEEKVSTTIRRKGSSKKLLEMINEVQIRLGFPLSKRLGEPNALKIKAFINDVITILLSCGRGTPFSEIKYKYTLKEGQRDMDISPANAYLLNGLDKLFINGKEITKAREINSRRADDTNGEPNGYVITGKSNHAINIVFDNTPKQDCEIDCILYEKPHKLERASERTVYETDLVVKGAEYLAKDDAGMGGDVSGRELFMRYLLTDSNLNTLPNEDSFYV